MINIVGGAARTPDANFLIGGSVNAAMANFSKGLAQIGNREDVNVNVIHPGMTETDRVEQLFQRIRAGAGQDAGEVRAESVGKSGSRRHRRRPEDVAEVALFLCERQGARHVQGTAIAVDGGSTPGYY